MNFPEYECDNEEILKLLSYLPITTAEDYPWLQKYINDLHFHYINAEYELAVISVHMIYMFIVYCFILKKREFDFGKIKSDFQDNKELCPKAKTDITPYLYVHKGDKRSFEYLKLDKSIKIQHMNIVKIRDQVAHCSGSTLNETDFIQHLKNCIKTITDTKNVIWNNFKQSSIFNNTLKNMKEWDDIVSIFLISPVEFKDIFDEKFSNELQKQLSDISFWQETFDDTSPGNYGINDYDIYPENIVFMYDDISSEYITGNFEADISMIIDFQMGASNPDDGYEEHYNKLHHITGYFNFDISSKNFTIEPDSFPSIDFYAE